LQAGDTIGGSASNQVWLSMANDPMTGCVKFSPMRWSAAGEILPAQADALANARVLGLALSTEAGGAQVLMAIIGMITGTTAEWDAITGGAGGLTPGALYFLDPTTPGMLTTTPPTAAGECVVEIGQALVTTELQVNIQRPILL